MTFHFSLIAVLDPAIQMEAPRHRRMLLDARIRFGHEGVGWSEVRAREAM